MTAPAAEPDLALKDPVCGMKVTTQSPHRLQHEGKPVYFCSIGCKTKFAANPAIYAASAAAPPAPAAATSSPPPAQAIVATAKPVAGGVVYTCPMHPEVRQDHPGACPKCGMALEPEMPALDEGENPELRDFRRRFLWTLPLTIVVTVLAMAGHRLHWFEMATQSWIELLLTLPIVLWAGWPFFERIHWRPHSAVRGRRCSNCSQRMAQRSCPSTIHWRKVRTRCSRNSSRS